MAAQDFEFTDDLVIDPITGDFSIIESDQQHIEHILNAAQGHFYQWPFLGADFAQLINSSETRQRIKQVITEHLAMDDYVVKDILIETTDNGTQIEVDADRRKK